LRWWWCGRCSGAGEVSQILAGRKDGCRSEKGSAKRAAIAGPGHTGSRAEARAGGRRRAWSSRDAVRGSRRRWAQCWQRLRWCKERLLEARGGGPKVWKRKGDSAGWPCGRGRYYYPPDALLAGCVPKPKPFSPLSLPGRGGRPCKCECSDTERTAFFTAVVSASAAGGHDAAHAHAHARRLSALPAGRALCRRCTRRALYHAAALRVQHASTRARHPHHALRALEAAISPLSAGCALAVAWGDDLLARPSGGQGRCMALQRPGLIRHGRCRARACDLREPLIIHRRRTSRRGRSALALCCRLCHRAACARRLLLAALDDAARGGMWPPKGSRLQGALWDRPRAVSPLHDSLAGRLCVAPVVCTPTMLHGCQLTHAASARVPPVSAPARVRPRRRLTIAVPRHMHPRPPRARIVCFLGQYRAPAGACWPVLTLRLS
jgi:hypothetical protein